MAVSDPSWRGPSVLFIHGGMTFPDHASFLAHLRVQEISLEPYRKWSDTLADTLAPIPVIAARMPCKENAHYDAWAIHFEKHLSLFDEVVLVGFSLGGIFLTKYLSENMPFCTIRAVYIVAAPYDDRMSDEPLTNGFVLGNDIRPIMDVCSRIVMFYSSNDTLVTLEHAQAYREALPDAQIITLDAADHFIQPEFPELIGRIRKDLG